MPINTQRRDLLLHLFEAGIRQNVCVLVRHKFASISMIECLEADKKGFSYQSCKWSKSLSKIKPWHSESICSRSCQLSITALCFCGRYRFLQTPSDLQVAKGTGYQVRQEIGAGQDLQLGTSYSPQGEKQTRPQSRPVALTLDQRWINWI